VVAATIDRVIDGDTVVVLIDGSRETIRLLGIDTPEKAGGPRPAECFGSQASAYATELLPVGTTVHGSRDRETRDQYGRLLAYLHRADDGVFVNLQMVETGHAVPLFFSPNTAARAEFTAAGDRARRDWIGLWPTCGAADVVLPGG
jgi:micrococcal nuclease